MMPAHKTILRDRVRRALATRPVAKPPPPSRRGLVHTGVYLAPAVHRRVAQASLDDGRPRQQIMAEAVEEWLAKRGR